jgi:hypothetical protein
VLLYHFTRAAAWDTIQHQGLIPGKTPFGADLLAVSLTTDLDPEGHGLFGGEVVEESRPEYRDLYDRAHFRITLPDGKKALKFADMKEIVLCIDVPAGDPALEHYEVTAKRELSKRQRNMPLCVSQSAEAGS